MHDYIALEMTMASIMAQQEASGFRFDLDAAERVKAELEQEVLDIDTFLKNEFAKPYRDAELGR